MFFWWCREAVGFLIPVSRPERGPRLFSGTWWSGVGGHRGRLFFGGKWIAFDHTVDGRNYAPKKPWNDDSPVHTNKNGFPCFSGGANGFCPSTVSTSRLLAGDDPAFGAKAGSCLSGSGKWSGELWGVREAHRDLQISHELAESASKMVPQLH